MVRIGRYTAALLMIAVGTLLLMNEITTTSFLIQMKDWWPTILICLGLEYIILNIAYHKGGCKLKWSVGNLLLAVLISAAAILITQNALGWEGLQFIKRFTVSDKGYSFEKPLLSIPLDDNTRKITVDNRYGSITMRTGKVDRIEIAATVWVDKPDQAAAETIANQSLVDFSQSSSSLTITSKGELNNLNMTITLPESSRQVDIELQAVNGKIEAERLPIRNELKIHTSNSPVVVTSVTGQVNISSTNGTIEIREASSGIKAETTNGSIRLTNPIVGGDWDLKTTNGGIDLAIPPNGDYQISGSARGRITTNLPLTIDSKQIHGFIGLGTYKLKMKTSNGGIDIHTIQ